MPGRAMMNPQERMPIALINWNSVEMTEQCLRRLPEATDRSRVFVIVIDNGSADPANQERLQTLQSEGFLDELILAGKNLGFSAAFNIAVERTQGDVFCYLSNDCLVEADWLDKAIATLFSDECVAAVCSNVYEEDKAGMEIPDKVISQLYGPIMLIRRTAWKDVGPFDAANFSPAYSEELDWSYRAIRKGYLLKLSGSSLAYHVGSYSTKKNLKASELSLLRLHHRIKCRLFNWTWYRLLLSPKTWRYCYLPELYYEIKNGNVWLLSAALKKNIKDWSHILYERRRRFRDNT